MTCHYYFHWLLLSELYRRKVSLGWVEKEEEELERNIREKLQFPNKYGTNDIWFVLIEIRIFMKSINGNAITIMIIIPRRFVRTINRHTIKVCTEAKWEPPRERERKKMNRMVPYCIQLSSFYNYYICAIGLWAKCFANTKSIDCKCECKCCGWIEYYMWCIVYAVCGIIIKYLGKFIWPTIQTQRTATTTKNRTPNENG